MYKTRTKNFAARHGLGVFDVTSNLAAFYEGLTFEGSHTFCNSATALTGEAHLDYYLYSSAKPLAEIGVRKSDALTHLDSIILPMLSTESLCFISSGASLNRFEKTELVARLPDATDLLDVCQSPAPDRIHQHKSNCSRCTKCIRTMTTLDLLSALDDFKDVFDVAFYRRHKTYLNYQVYKHAQRGSGLDIEVVDTAAAMGHPLPRAPYIPALFYMRRAREKGLAKLQQS